MSNKLYSNTRVTPFLVIKNRINRHHKLECLKVKVPCLSDIITINYSNFDEFSCKFKIKNHHINDKDNLVLDVWDEMNKLYKNEYSGKEIPNFKINLEKRIPVEAGLAGGSPNAATVIKKLNKILNLNKSLNELIEIGNKLGKDICFFLTDYKIAIDTEIDGIEKIPYSFPKAYMLIITPDIKISSKKAYKLYDENSPNNKIKPDINNIISAIKDNDIEKFSKNLYNSFEPVIFKQYPELEELKNEIDKKTLGSCLSGSGSTITAFLNYNNEEKTKALNLIEYLKDKNIPYIKLIDTKEWKVIN